MWLARMLKDYWPHASKRPQENGTAVVMSNVFTVTQPSRQLPTGQQTGHRLRRHFEELATFSIKPGPGLPARKNRSRVALDPSAESPDWTTFRALQDQILVTCVRSSRYIKRPGYFRRSKNRSFLHFVKVYLKNISY